MQSNLGLDEVTQIQKNQQTNSSDWTSAIDVVEIGSILIDAASDLVSSIDLSL